MSKYIDKSKKEGQGFDHKEDILGMKLAARYSWKDQQL